MPDEQEARECATCGRTVMHSGDQPQPHMRPVAGGIRCPASPPRPTRP